MSATGFEAAGPSGPDPSEERGQRSPRDAARADHLGFVSHEIRNPLAAALWSAELLARLPDAERAGARGRKLARTCLRALGRVRRLTEDHLLSERLDAGDIEPYPESLPAESLVPEDPEALGATALTVDLEHGLVVEADASLARRALEAAVLAAAREGGPVRLEGRRHGASCHFRVTGAPPREGELADPGRGSESDPRGGSLALAAGRRAAEACGGALMVSGRCFVVAFPVADAGGDPGPGPAGQSGPPGGGDGSAKAR
jgi:K+-sensing histidine kinase KdpD